MYVLGTDPSVRTVKVSNSVRLRSKENEAIQQYKFVVEVCEELKLAVLGGNSCAEKCQRRALKSGFRTAEAAIAQTAEVHKWAKIVFEQARVGPSSAGRSGRIPKNSQEGGETPVGREI
jgi:hypothetical protein